jgi:DNA mismatch repair protein MutS
LDLEIEGGRHPVVDRPGTSPFTPNDLNLRSIDRRVLLITGPNMGGKSTYLRQAAILVILGQMGAPVPAKRARWGVFHSVHTRIGAHDAIARGQSTFMVEMTELAQILHQADERSLLVLDEIGRGTSTYDGMSVAWAALEWIATKLRSRALFATHYHELTARAAQVPGIANAHLAVEGKGSEIRFLYELRPGPASESFGIQVALMAGVPSSVVARASKVLIELERGGEEPTPQLSFFGQGLFEQPMESSLASALEPLRPFLGEIAGIEIEKMTPLEALSLLSKLQTKAQTLASSLPST